VTVKLTTGEELAIFLKNFGASQLSKDGLPQRRERELRVYRDLLTEADLGTATYYGSVWDESHGRFWLLLELVPSTEVRYCEFRYWVETARWLARMQGYFGAVERRKQLSMGDYLIQHDAAFFHDKAEQARRAVATFPPAFSARLAPILHKYEQMVEMIAHQPRTFVHGHYRPYNILVNIEATPPRICPVDWEVAALGSPLYDLAFLSDLSDGFAGSLLDQLCAAYQQEALRHGLALPGRAEIQFLVDCFLLHRMLMLLGKAVKRQFSESGVAQLLDRVEMFSNRL
jgi:aminoglycoside phosphotransferase (APT) family kinase protein